MSDQDILDILRSRASSDTFVERSVDFFDCEDDVLSRERNARPASALIEERASLESTGSLSDLRLLLSGFSRACANNGASVSDDPAVGQCGSGWSLTLTGRAQSDLARIWLDSDSDDRQRLKSDLGQIADRLASTTDHSGARIVDEPPRFAIKVGIVRAHYRLDPACADSVVLQRIMRSPA